MRRHSCLQHDGSQQTKPATAGTCTRRQRRRLRRRDGACCEGAPGRLLSSLNRQLSSHSETCPGNYDPAPDPGHCPVPDSNPGSSPCFASGTTHPTWMLWPLSPKSCIATWSGTQTLLRRHVVHAAKRCRGGRIAGLRRCGGSGAAALQPGAGRRPAQRVHTREAI